MLSFSFWRRHKKKILVSLGVLGSGYVLYKLYVAQKRRLWELDNELTHEREVEERIKAQMQEHFENIQRIANSTTLPHAMNFLSKRIDEELNISDLTERLNQGKDTLTLPEKLELWDRLKVMSFTKTVLSLWSVTMLSLFVRVQVNILGRHLYIDIARGLENSPSLEEGTLIDHDDEQKFLSSADFLANYGLASLINDMQVAVTETLKSKQLKDAFNSSILHDTIIQILDIFMSMWSPHHWMTYFISEDVKSPSFRGIVGDASKFELLMMEVQAVLSSDEFTNVVEVSLKTVTNTLVRDVVEELSSGIPLVKLVPRVAQMSRLLLEEPSRNRFIQMIANIQEVELFFTILYANASTP